MSSSPSSSSKRDDLPSSRGFQATSSAGVAATKDVPKATSPAAKPMRPNLAEYDTSTSILLKAPQSDCVSEGQPRGSIASGTRQLPGPLGIGAAGSWRRSRIRWATRPPEAQAGPARRTRPERDASMRVKCSCSCSWIQVRWRVASSASWLVPCPNLEMAMRGALTASATARFGWCFG